MKTKNIGGSTAQEQLDLIENQVQDINPIGKQEFLARINKAAEIMVRENINAIYLHAGTSLTYFTGMKWNASERMVGAFLTAQKELHFIGPKFEEGTIQEFMVIEGDLHCWEEHENPAALFIQLLGDLNINKGTIGLDEKLPFFSFDAIRKLNKNYRFINAKIVTAGCRMRKSENELAIIQRAMDITLKVQEAASRILRPGITSAEVSQFIHQAHIKAGVPSGNYFCIVLFGVDSSFPHGVKNPNPLQQNEIVLIDTGCQIFDYISDITRSYVFGEINDTQRKIWNIEKELQETAFQAAQLGKPCSDIDDVVRQKLAVNNLGPEYVLPGTPHRTGHGIGMDIHEWPYIVKNESTLLAPGMTFSIEPMICLPDQFGIRLEDHIYMSENGPKWFTKPSGSVEAPFDKTL